MSTSYGFFEQEPQRPGGCRPLPGPREGGRGELALAAKSAAVLLSTLGNGCASGHGFRLNRKNEPGSGPRASVGRAGPLASMYSIYGHLSWIALSTGHWLERMGSSAGALVMSLGGLGVLLLAIADSSFLSVPEGNDILIILLSAGGPWGRMAYFVAMTIVGSVIGCLILYTVGRKGGQPILRRRFSEQKIESARRMYLKWGIFTVLIPSIIPPPMPFKIFVLSAGVFRMSLAPFLGAVLLGRTVRYATWGILAVLYGEPIKVFVENNLGLIGRALFGLFLLAAAAVAAYYLTVKRRRLR